jgi:hypothetical protein
MASGEICCSYTRVHGTQFRPDANSGNILFGHSNRRTSLYPSYPREASALRNHFHGFFRNLPILYQNALCRPRYCRCGSFCPAGCWYHVSGGARFKHQRSLRHVVAVWRHSSLCPRQKHLRHDSCKRRFSTVDSEFKLIAAQKIVRDLKDLNRMATKDFEAIDPKMMKRSPCSDSEVSQDCVEDRSGVITRLNRQRRHNSDPPYSEVQQQMVCDAYRGVSPWIT